MASALDEIDPRALAAVAQATAAISFVHMARYALATRTAQKALTAFRATSLTAAQASRAMAIRMRHGVRAATAYTVAARAATIAQRGLNVALAAVGGVGGLALLATYGVIELWRASRSARRQRSDLRGLRE